MSALLCLLSVMLAPNVAWSQARLTQSKAVSSNQFTTMGTPPPPTNLTVTRVGTTNDIQLTWTAASPSRGYRIYEGNPDPYSGTCAVPITYVLVGTLTDPNATTFTDTNRIGQNEPPGSAIWPYYCYQVYNIVATWTSSPATGIIKIGGIRGPVPSSNSLFLPMILGNPGAPTPTVTGGATMTLREHTGTVIPLSTQRTPATATGITPAPGTPTTAAPATRTASPTVAPPPEWRPCGPHRTSLQLCRRRHCGRQRPVRAQR